MDYKIDTSKSLSKAPEPYNSIVYWTSMVPQKLQTQHIHIWIPLSLEISFSIVNYLCDFYLHSPHCPNYLWFFPTPPSHIQLITTLDNSSNLASSRYFHLSLFSLLLSCFRPPSSLFQNIEVTTFVANHCFPSLTSPFILFTTVQPMQSFQTKYDHKIIMFQCYPPTLE